MSKNVLITGASGMIGGLILNHCLNSESVGKVNVLVRKKLNIHHPKLTQFVVQDFMQLENVAHAFLNIDICYYCLGVYTGATDRETFKKITVDYTQNVAAILIQNNVPVNFVLLSGQGADSSEKSKLMFAQDKGSIENKLLKMKFNAVQIFRPGYIYPVEKRTEPNFMYRLLRVLYNPLFLGKFKNFSITSEQLAEAMFNAGLDNKGNQIYENFEIKKLIGIQ